MATRPTHDGSDHGFRMTIDDRYKRMAGLRRTIRVTATMQLAYVVLRTLWHSIPALTGEPRLTATTEWIFYGGLVVFGLRAWAFGFGKANRERLWAIMLYSIASMLLTVECILVFYQYHIDEKMMGRVAGKQYPQMLAKHFAARVGLAPTTFIFLAQWYERILDLVGIGASCTNVYSTKEYVMERKEAASEAAGGKKDD